MREHSELMMTVGVRLRREHGSEFNSLTLIMLLVWLGQSHSHSSNSHTKGVDSSMQVPQEMQTLWIIKGEVLYNSMQRRTLQYTSQQDVVSINTVSLVRQGLKEKKTIYHISASHTSRV